MNVDTLGLVSKNEGIMVHSVIQLVRISFLVDGRGEDPDGVMLHDLKNRRGMDDHEVDTHTTGSISTGTAGSRRSIDGHSGIEPGRGDSDDPHIIVEFYVGIYVVLRVDDPSFDVALQLGIDERIHEQDSAFVGNFVVIHRRFGGIDKGSHICIRSDGSSSTVNTSCSSPLSKSVIRFSAEVATLCPSCSGYPQDCCISLCR